MNMSNKEKKALKEEKEPKNTNLEALDKSGKELSDEKAEKIASGVLCGPIDDKRPPKFF